MSNFSDDTFDKTVHEFYGPIEEDVDKYVNQQITKEEFLSSFKKHCESDICSSYDEFAKVSSRMWGITRHGYGYDEYKRLVSVLDEILYHKNDSTQGAEKGAKRVLGLTHFYPNSLMFKEYSMHPSRTSLIAAHVLSYIASNGFLEKAVIDFYNENPRKTSDIVSCYDGHLDYVNGTNKDLESLLRYTEREEKVTKREEEKKQLSQKITDKLQELKSKTKSENIGDIPHLDMQILREVGRDNVSPEKVNHKRPDIDKIVIKAAIEEATEKFRK